MPSSGGCPARESVAASLRSIDVAVVLVVVLGLVWLSLDILLLFFAGVLLAVFLRSIAAPIERHTPLSRGWALAAAVMLVVAVVATATAISSQRLVEQSASLTDQIPRAVDRVESALGQAAWGRWLLDHAPQPTSLLPSRQRIMPMTTTLLSGTVGTVMTIFVVLFLGLYLAARPEFYRDGVVRLLPRSRRARVTGVLDEVGSSLRWWIAGKLLSMATIGVATTLGLLALGIPTPIALGFIAAVLTFVPNFGPVMAAIPAVLLGLLTGPETALSVLALYAAIQLVESYLLTPLVQQRTVSLPPGLTIAAQVVLGALSGVLGLALATPLVAAGLVLTKRLYVEDVLGDRLAGDGAEPDDGTSGAQHAPHVMQRARRARDDHAGPATQRLHRSGPTIYPPLDVPMQIADDVWIVDGPAIDFGVSGMHMPFPTRMTILRHPEGLLVHSPTELTAALRTAVERIGMPRWIVGPNRLHSTWIARWHDAYPAAHVLLAPSLRAKMPASVTAVAREIGRDDSFVWSDTIATLPVAGAYLTEIVLFHRPSRTLVLTDLIENFEPAKMASAWTRWLTRLGGVQDPEGGMPRDLRLTFLWRRDALRRDVETMLAWQPERIVLSHGRWYAHDGTRELRRAFAWLLGSDPGRRDGERAHSTATSAGSGAPR